MLCIKTYSLLIAIFIETIKHNNTYSSRICKKYKKREWEQNNHNNLWWSNISNSCKYIYVVYNFRGVGKQHQTKKGRSWMKREKGAIASNFYCIDATLFFHSIMTFRSNLFHRTPYRWCLNFCSFCFKIDYLSMGCTAWKSLETLFEIALPLRIPQCRRMWDREDDRARAAISSLILRRIIEHVGRR